MAAGGAESIGGEDVVVGVGEDEAKLGRWSWTRYQGTFDRMFRVVNVYRSVVGKEFNSAYMQQYRHSL